MTRNYDTIGRELDLRRQRGDTPAQLLAWVRTEYGDPQTYEDRRLLGILEAVIEMITSPPWSA